MSLVLAVDDEPQLPALITNLRARGYEVDAATTGEIALEMAARHHPDVVVLDLGLPTLSGIEVIRGLRGWSEVPIIVLSARDAERDKIAALDAGADDYVTKPFGMGELLARVRAALRRGAPGTEEAVVVTDAFTIDLAAKRVTNGDGEVRLTPTEWHLVEVLVRNAGKLVTQDASCVKVCFLETTDRTFELHRGGKLYTGLKTGIRTRDDLSMAYTPGVARVCSAIEADPEGVRVHDQAQHRRRRERRHAVLGLGDIGPEAALPVMEGKAVLFKEFADVDAFPICLDTKDPDEIVRAVKLIAPGFGGINLEDISSPRCFEIESRLIEELDIPVFHDDQHGTAIVVLAALLNACRLTDRAIEDVRVAMIGAGAAGVAVAKILMGEGVNQIVACDRQGSIHSAREDYLGGSMNVPKTWLAENTNLAQRNGTITGALEEADVFIGLSGPGLVEATDLERMNRTRSSSRWPTPTRRSGRRTPRRTCG